MMRKMKRLRALVSSVLAVSVAAVSLPMAFAERTAGEGLWAEYYSGRAFDTFVSSAGEAAVDHVWSEGSYPAGLSGVENFSARYVGRILAEEAGDYTIYANVDDGAKVFIDGRLAIHDAGPHFPAENAASFTWEAGTFHTIKIEYYNGELGGTMQLKWSTPSKQKEVIPTGNLFFGQKADMDWVSGQGKIAARAHIYWEDDKAYEAVLESYDEDGKLADVRKTARPRGGDTVWSTESVAYADGMTYRAYLTDADGGKVSDEIEKVYAVDGTLEVDAADVTGQISPYLNGACIEDVNHELYGGIWAQMVFGEAFAETPSLQLDGFSTAGGEWKTEQTESGPVLAVDEQSNGPKMVLDDTDCESGVFSADGFFEGAGPVGFTVKTSKAGPGSDNFYGYEVGLVSGGVKVARHENNYDGDSAKTFSCDAAPGRWINLKVETTKDNIAVFVDGVKAGDYPTAASVTAGKMGLRAWSGSGKYKNFQFQRAGGEVQQIPVPVIDGSVSGMWAEVKRGTAEGGWELDKTDPYTKSLISSGAQSQRLIFESGEGAVGVNNMGLNRKGMNFEKDKAYEGYIYARSLYGADVYVVLESADGSEQYGEAKLEVESGNGWEKYAFQITPDQKDAAGRMTVELRGAGTADLGYAYLQPGEWGRYKGLPIRKDVAEKLEGQNLSFLRFGGSMINVADYKWKHMLGAPEDRPTYNGCWYSYSTFGFGMKEFLDLCEALGVMGIPTFNSYETKEDMADFIDFATGTDPRNEWVKKRIEMGHPEPYDLPYLQIGNEERIDNAYAGRFNGLAPTIWEKDDDIILIGADLVYDDVITDPYNFTGAASGITSLEGHKAIMDLAKQKGRTVYFDVHTWTHNPDSSAKYTEVLVSFYNALHQVCPGTDTKVVIFEYNALAHNMERGLANAYATIDMEKYSDMFPIVSSANCLQVDGHNDNGWDQGLVFMDNDSSWYQPPAYVTQMSGGAYQPNRVAARLDGAVDGVNYVAGRSDDGESLTLKFLNNNASELGISTLLKGLAEGDYDVTVTTLRADNLSDTNTADNPEKIKPVVRTLENGVRNNKLLVTLAPKSYTVVTIVKSTDAPVIKGDVTGDGEVNISDVMGACKILARKALQQEPNADEIARADMNGDGFITITDIMALCKILASRA